MKVIIVEKPFRHSDDGNTVNQYEPGEQVVSDRCAEVAVKHLKVAKESKKTPEQFAEEKAKSEGQS
ncbi:hypothetical protein [uncultured Amphritea sp.]|uniref:hypothetical protein n=1 Tax=uncultured Amphritea sp. TaxID=981605 RepID=UPI00260B9CD5|nr:hypothetical protein [uncultured Amphritea sp.]